MMQSLHGRTLRAVCQPRLVLARPLRLPTLT